MVVSHQEERPTHMTICHFCPEPGKINAPHWTGTEYIRVDVCDNDRDELARPPRKPRQPRPEPQLAGEWAMVVSMMSGKSFDELLDTV